MELHHRTQNTKSRACFAVTPKVGGRKVKQTTEVNFTIGCWCRVRVHLHEGFYNNLAVDVMTFMKHPNLAGIGESAGPDKGEVVITVRNHRRIDGVKIDLVCSWLEVLDRVADRGAWAGLESGL